MIVVDQTPTGAVRASVELDYPVQASWTFIRPGDSTVWKPVAVKVAGDGQRTIGLTLKAGVVEPSIAARLDQAARDAGLGRDAAIVALPQAPTGPEAA